MKRSIYAISLISLAFLTFSTYVQADGVTKVQLSSAPTLKTYNDKRFKGNPLVVVKPRVIFSPRVLRTSRVANRLAHLKAYKQKKAARVRVARANKARLKRVQINRLRANKARISKRVVVRSKLNRGKGVRYHYVRGGDSLYKVARKYGVTVKHILRVNKLKSTSIKVGTRLKVL